MKEPKFVRNPERGGAGVKFVLVFVVLILIGHAGLQYIPVAYNGASLKQEMDTAVVKGLAASGQMKPMDIVTASVRRAAVDYDTPSDALIEIKPENGVVLAHVAYVKQVNMLPFGLYKYKYDFDYTAHPTGYLLKESK